MSQLVLTTQFQVNAFSVSKIIFDDSDVVSMEVACRVNESLINTTFLFSFAMFNDMLRLSGTMGEQLQLQASDKLLSNEEPPYIITLNQSPIIFTNCALTVSYLIADDNSCLSVDKVLPLSFLQQAKNLKTNMKDFSGVTLNTSTGNNIALHELAKWYRFYLGLVSLNISNDVARSKAGLRNDKLFKLAYYAANR